MNNNYEVIIIGGSNAGLSAAMALGRSLRSILVIDSGLPCNRFTPHSHNFITHDGSRPSEILTLAKNQVARYETVSFVDGLAVKAERVADKFVIRTAGGQTFTGKKLIIATGIKDLFPDIEGFAQTWGNSVIHCPYCHGFEFRGKITGLLANGDRAVHMMPLIYNLTRQLTIFTNGTPTFTRDQMLKFSKYDVEVIEVPLVHIAHHNSRITQVQLEDGRYHKLDALYAPVPFEQHSDIPVQLGCELTETGHIKVDGFQQTTVSGVYACGDNSSGMRAIASAIATGNLAGAMVNMELSKEAFN